MNIFQLMLMSLEDLLLVKLGGSVLTYKDRPFSPRLDVIERLANEIHRAREEKDIKLVIAHGGGSFPHVPAKKYNLVEGIKDKESLRGIAETQDAASRLNRIVVNKLIEAGENAVSIQPSASLVAESGEIVEWYLEPLKGMLERDLIPVPYGDVVIDRKIGCSIISTEKLLAYLARELKPSRILLLVDVDGVYSSSNPKDFNESNLIKEINSKNFRELEASVSGSYGIDVTGGMLSKVKLMLNLAKEGVESEILNGLKEGYLERALLGERGLGTRIKY